MEENKVKLNAQQDAELPRWHTHLRITERLTNETRIASTDHLRIHYDDVYS